MGHMGIYFTIERIPRGQNSNSKESLLLLFDGLWKVKTKYIALHLNALTNSSVTGEHFATQF